MGNLYSKPEQVLWFDYLHYLIENKKERKVYPNRLVISGGYPKLYCIFYIDCRGELQRHTKHGFICNNRNKRKSGKINNINI